MKIAYEQKEKVPVHYLSYFINGDFSGMSNEEKKICDDWRDKSTEEIRKKNPGAVIIELVPCDDTENEYFSNSPSFGLPCAVCDMFFIVFLK